jgi:hypothetical protein
MTLLKGQLGKLTFIFYPNSKAPGIGVPYVPMYNPTSFTVTHDVHYDKKAKVNTADLVKKFLCVKPRVVNMELFFDGTGASPSTLGGFGNKAGVNVSIKGVEGQIQTFLKAAYQIAGVLHKPNYVMLVWGTFIMTGVLESANVTYTMFAADGTPLRAKMSISIKEHVDFSLVNKILNLKSPDISKSIVVQEGDTLPLLCYKEYGDSSYYTKVAKVNNLKNYRKLKQGMELLFPPINNLS